ncbi:pyridoxal 5'-phosphate synthase glutaminase subunit PdxT [Desulforudis sp. 1088]|uniref:pyridoxal 5'-phosphate synthase glutaminase subunit PdxT n=1 Tax=unclassified Candidatus Desulforudis TaxID=2635950 RepID=UPI003497B372
MKVGILALQGAFIEHARAVRACGHDPVEIRKPEQLDDCRALIIPGGESTTIGKLMNEFNLFEVIRARGEQGMPILGTCAGMVLLARVIEESDQPRLGLMNITVKRNAFGRQVDSFEADLAVPTLGDDPVRAVFIRAPYITAVGPGVEVLAVFDGKIVLVRQDRLVASAFHPELTEDLRLHKYFLNLAG